MGNKTKGAKVRKHGVGDNGWTTLFDEVGAVAFISRPTRRTPDALKFLAALTADVSGRARSGEPSLCFNEAHDYEFRTVPDVFAVVRLSDDAPPGVMGICPECAKQSDAEIYAIMRRQFKRFGFGRGDSGHAQVEVEIRNVAWMEAVPGVRVAIALSDQSESPFDCAPGMAFILLLRRGALPRFMAFRRGKHNCHAIVEQLYLDFKQNGVATSFTYKRGSTPILASRKDPDGLHSWIETNGWVIDASGGATGQPIVVQRVADFYDRMKVTSVHAIRME